MNYFKSNTKFVIILGSSMLLMNSCKTPKYNANHRIDLPNQFNTKSEPVKRFTLNDFFKDQFLNEIIKDVLSNNPDINIALQNIKMSHSQLRTARKGFLPSLDAVGRSSGTRYGKYTMEGVGNYDTNLSPNIEDDQKINTDLSPDYWLGLSASWEIDIWGKIRNKKNAAKNRFMAAEFGNQWLKTTLVTQTARLYYELIALDNEAKIIHENAELQSKALEIVIIQKEGGRATELAVQQFKAQLLNTKANEFQIQQKIVEVENSINVLRGKYGTIIKRSEELNSENVTQLANIGIPSQLLEMRPDIQQSIYLLKAQKADVKAAVAAFFPNLNLTAFGAYNAFNSGLIFKPGSLAFQVLGNLTAPIFQKGILKNQFNIATSEAEKAFYEFQKNTLNAYKEVENQFSAIKNTSEYLKLKNEEVKTLETALVTSNDLFFTGYATYLEIISAQRSKLEAQLQLINAKKDNINANIELYKASGGYWE
jgi:multidrug efflux system outer membrane protein